MGRRESRVKRQVRRKAKAGRVRDTEVRGERGGFVFHMDSCLSVGLSFTLPRSLTLSLSRSQPLSFSSPFSVQLLAFSPSLYLSPSLPQSPSLLSLRSPFVQLLFLSSLLCLCFLLSSRLFCLHGWNHSAPLKSLKNT